MKILIIFIMVVLTLSAAIPWVILTIQGRPVSVDDSKIIDFLIATATTLLGVHIGGQNNASHGPDSTPPPLQ